MALAVARPLGQITYQGSCAHGKKRARRPGKKRAGIARHNGERSPFNAMTETVPPVADAATRDQRALLDSILTAAIRAAHPDLCLPPHLPEPSPGRLIILAAGKAAGSMSAAQAFRFQAKAVSTMYAPLASSVFTGAARARTPPANCARMFS